MSTHSIIYYYIIRFRGGLKMSEQDKIERKHRLEQALKGVPIGDSGLVYTNQRMTSRGFDDCRPERLATIETFYKTDCSRSYRRTSR